MATGQCPSCNTPNEYSVAACTMCGTRLPWAPALGATPAPPASTSAVPATPSQTQAPGHFANGVNKKAAATLGGYALFALVVLFLVGRGNQAPDNPSSPDSQPGTVLVPPPPAVPLVRRGPSFNEADSHLDGRLTTWTEAQQQAYWQSISGSLVTWEGEVQEVKITSGGEIMLKCNPKSWGTDTFVTLDGTQISQLSRINKSQRVTVQGILTNHGDSGYDIDQAKVMNF